MLYNQATLLMSDQNDGTLLTKFLSNKIISVPDNQTPDTEMGLVIKNCIVEIANESLEKVVNEANLSQDLHFDFPKFKQLFVRLKEIFQLESEVLDLKMKQIERNFELEGPDYPFVLPTVGEMIALYEWMAKPCKGYLCFDMREVLSEIRVTSAKVSDDKPGSFLSYLKNIPDDIAVEELPIYRDYLSKFNLSPFLRDKRILTAADDKISKEDCDLFIKLVCGSLSSSFDFLLNEEKNGIELIIHVMNGETPITKKTQ